MSDIIIGDPILILSSILNRLRLNNFTILVFINFFQSTKDVQLNAFYIRGYSEAENLVSSAEEGLVRAARQDYAFFAGQRVARSTLRFLFT